MSKKSSIARLLSDFIKADSIIDGREIEALNRLSEFYNIHDKDKVEAQKMQFSEAVAELMDMPYAQRKQLIAHLHEMTLADGKCVEAEALLLMAVSCCLGEERIVRSNAGVLSAETLGLQFDRPKMIYVENDYNAELNVEIQSNQRAIYNELGMVGIDFVYIPKISNDFRMMNEDYLKGVITYLAPSIKPDRRDDIYALLCGITTKQFCSDLLSRKLGIEPGCFAEPALLVTLGATTMPEVDADGAVVQRSYNQYLRLRIGDGVMKAIARFVDRYKEYLGSLTSTMASRSLNSLAYYGFHRSLFDLLLYSGKRQKCTLLFDANSGVLKFREIDEEVNLSRKIKATYLTMLQQVLCSGERKMRYDDATIQAFREIYYEVGCDDTDNEYIDLTASLTRIRSELAKHSLVQNIDCFMPARGRNSVITMNVDASMVWIADGNDVVRLTDSRWSRFGSRRK